jgi:glycosyltransferase involved in cell wall biosynthesis
MTTFSIVLTYYKDPEKLSRALYCLSQQTYAFFEVITVFDGEDPVAKLIYEQFCNKKQDARFKPVISPPRDADAAYGNAIRRTAMDYCCNDYIIWYSHDCLIDKDYLQTHADQIDGDQCISIVSQEHFTWWDHPQGWTLYREGLPCTADPAALRMGQIDLLNFALPTDVARRWAWREEHQLRYEADWFTLWDCMQGSELPVRISDKVVCAHF